MITISYWDLRCLKTVQNWISTFSCLVFWDMLFQILGFYELFKPPFFLLNRPSPVIKTSSCQARSPASVYRQELERLLECNVCLDIYKDPVMLDCGHQFCEQCVRSLKVYVVKKHRALVSVNGEITWSLFNPIILLPHWPIDIFSELLSI